MSVLVEAESTLTDRYQTTVPESVRRALHLNKRDKIHYTVRPDGEVVLKRAEGIAEPDPALGSFLAFLQQDIAEHPEHLQVVDIHLVQRIRSLTGEVEVDLDRPLDADNE